MTEKFWAGFIKEAKIYGSLAQALNKPKSSKILSGKEFVDSIAAKRMARHLEKAQKGQVNLQAKQFAQKAIASKPKPEYSASFQQKAKSMNPASVYRQEGIGVDKV